MGESCRDGTWWYSLLRDCVSCDRICQHSILPPKCTNHCASKKCTAVPGHYYDLLLKKCIRCASVCGSHPQECSQHCLTTPQPATSWTPRIPRTSTLKVGHSQTHPGVLLPVSVPLLYSLLGLCVLMLVCILGLSLLVLLRTARKRPTRLVKPGPTVTTQEEGAIQKGCRGDDGEGNGHGRNYKQPLSTCRSNPTESCECTHCFPDLRVPCRGVEGEARIHYSLHQQTSSSSSPQHSGTPGVKRSKAMGLVQGGWGEFPACEMT